MVQQITVFTARNENKVHSQWMSRGELTMKVGEATASQWIERGKLEKGEDSDGDSVYRMKTRSNVQVQRHDTSCSAGREGEVDKSEYEGVKDSLGYKFKKTVKVVSWSLEVAVDPANCKRRMKSGWNG